LLRRGGRRGAGRAVSFLGYAIVSASAYLGGHLVYGERIGVNHATETLPEPEFTPALADADLKEGEPQRVEVNGAPVFLLRQGGRIHALANRCAHLGGPLSEGEIREGCVTCPWHRSTFSLEDGRVIQGPSAYPQPVLETRVRDGQIEVRGPQKEQ
jgi:nitrite reductase/ring-hydroxylating ferredoxin subunit